MSNFKIISRPLGTIERHVLQRNDGAEFEIMSGYGGGLNAWRIPVTAGNSPAGKSLDLLFGYRDGDDVFKIGPDTNAGCRLCPFPGRTAYAQFTWRGTTYKLINNVSWAPHALHGFLQNQEWKFESFESDSESCTAVFTCDWPGAFAGFPFPYRATNTIVFTGETVTVTSSVRNTGNTDMPYSEGWHPYFMLGEKIDGLTMTLPENSLALLDKARPPHRQLQGRHALYSRAQDWRRVHQRLLLPRARRPEQRPRDGFAARFHRTHRHLAKDRQRAVQRHPDLHSARPHEHRHRAHDFGTRRAEPPPRPHRNPARRDTLVRIRPYI